MQTRALTIVALSVIASASAEAQSLTSRKSGVSYTYVYGAGGDSHSDSVSIPDNLPVASDNESIEYKGSTSGVLPNGQPYFAGVDGIAQHEFSITGPLNGFSSISASGSTSVSTVATGAGVAQLIMSNPGNELVLEFNIAAPTDYQLSGSIDLPGPSAFSLVALQYFDGIVWQNSPFNSIFLPGGEGSFDKSGTLGPGLYRVYSVLSLDAFGNETFTASYNYRLTVPTPAGALPMIFGLAGLSRRKR